MIILVILIALFNYLLMMTGYCVEKIDVGYFWDQNGYDPICREIKPQTVHTLLVLSHGM